MTEATERIVAGIGFASAASADEIIALIEVCFAEASLATGQLVAIGTHTRKLGNVVPLQVAAHFGVPLRVLDDSDLSMEGLAEGVASAAGPLRLGRRKSRYATCALADCRSGFSIVAFGQPPIARAPIASSIVATSSAGP